MSKFSKEAESVAPSTCFWFPNNNALEAATYYTSLLPNSRITEDGGIMVCWELNGIPFKGLNGGDCHKPSCAASIYLSIPNQAEVDRLWDTILGDGGREDSCGWIQDKFGVSWQLVPDCLGSYLGGDDEAGRSRALAVFMTMRKISIAALEAAYKGGDEKPPLA